MNKKIHILVLINIALLLASCATTNIKKYYSQNRITLDSISQTYRQQYTKGSFSILFTDKSFKHVSVEIATDTIKYIYEFETNEKRLGDTLIKYHLSVNEMEGLITAMRSIKCSWISNLDYYEDGNKNSLVYMSIRSKSWSFPLIDKKYYILTYYSQPQYYDSEGRLVDRRRRKHLRKINKDIFYRINDKVCYTVSDLFR
jgi:hypothetical protein